MMEAIRQFIEAQRAAAHTRSLWFEDNNIHVYLRAGEYHLDVETRQWKWTVGISHVYLTREADKGKGYFKTLVTAIEQWAKDYSYDGIRIEEVRYPPLQQWCIKHGYTIDPTREDPQAYKKL